MSKSLVSDELWNAVAPLLPPPHARTGRRLLLAAYTQLRLARPLVADRCLPYTQGTVKPAGLTRGRM